LTGEKLGHRADAEAITRADLEAPLERLWWSRLPWAVTRPVALFEALRDNEDEDHVGRQEPILAIVILAGIAGILLTPAWGEILDQPSVDGLVAAVLTFIGGAFYGGAGYVLLGLAVWAGARSVGSLERGRLARHVVGFSAVPMALSVVLLVPVILLAFGGDYFHRGGSDEGIGRWLVVGLGLSFAAWSVGLLALGLRTTYRLPWRGVLGAVLLGGVIVAAFVVVPLAL
jgi:hypothetical protein